MDDKFGTGCFFGALCVMVLIAIGGMLYLTDSLDSIQRALDAYGIVDPEKGANTDAH